MLRKKIFLKNLPFVGRLLSMERKKFNPRVFFRIIYQYPSTCVGLGQCHLILSKLEQKWGVQNATSSVMQRQLYEEVNHQISWWWVNWCFRCWGTHFLCKREYFLWQPFHIWILVGVIFVARHIGYLIIVHLCSI